MRREPPTLATVAWLARELLRETQRLRKDVIALHDRIERRETNPSPVDLPAEQREATLPEAVSVLRNARTLILACEHHLAAIRSQVDALSPADWQKRHRQRREGE